MTYSNLYEYGRLSLEEAGIEPNVQDEQDIANGIINFSTLDKIEYEQMCRCAMETAKQYDFLALTDKLIKIIEE